MKALILRVIKLYQLWCGIKHQVLFSIFGYNSYCKHTPTCSRYLEDQMRRHGTIVGLWRGFRRVLTCW